MAGRVQLAVTGIQDQWLTGEPQFSYFVTLFKRHTRFSTESVEMPFTGDNSFGSSVECRIPTNIGDLIRGMILKVKLGNLTPHQTGSVPSYRYYYNIPVGKSIIKYADLMIGGQIIERLTGDYIYMYDQLHSNKDDADSGGSLYFMNGHNETLTVSDSYNTFYVNLPFYFHRNPSLAVPICALTKQLVEVRITFRDIDDDVSFKYTIPSNGQVTREKTTEGSIKSASLITDFYFITEDEKNFLLTRSMEYVITQLQKSTIQFKQGELKKSALLKFTNPVKELLFLAKEETGNNYSETIALPESLNLLGTAIVSGSAWDGILPSDKFGRPMSMSTDGTRVAIGTPYADGVNGTGSGRVQVYELIGSSWTQVGNDIDGEAAGDRFGHSVSMSADGTRVAIGAPYASGGSDGHVQVYDLIGSSWTQVGATIVGTGSGAKLLSGFSVSLSADGSRVAIGAPEADHAYDLTLPMNGQVIVYDLIGTSWTQVGDIIYGNNTFYWGAKSGWSISLSSNGSMIAIGSLYSNGRVQVFDLIGSVWTQVGNDINGEAPVSSDFITSVSVSLSSDGSRVAIGQPKNNRGGGILASGHVRVFDLIGSSWTQVGVDIDGEIADEQVGYSVSLSSDGSRVAVGAPSNGSSGHVRIYEWSGSAWVQIGDDIDGELGNSVVPTWVQRIAGTSLDEGKAIAVDSGGNVYVTGYYQSTVPLSLGGAVQLPVSTGRDTFIVKYNSSGNPQWYQTISGTSSDEAKAIAVDSGGNVYVTGNYQSTTPVSLGPSLDLPVSTGSDTFIVKYDTSGTAQWFQTISGTSTDVGYGIAVDSGGNVCVTGNYQSTTPVSLGPSLDLPVSTGSDIFIVKYNSSGTAQWFQTISETSYGEGTAIAVDSSGSVYVTGNYSSSTPVSLGNNLDLPVSPGSDTFIVKYNSSGTAQWFQTIAGNQTDVGYGIKVDSSGSVYVTGNYSSTITVSLGNNLDLPVSHTNTPFIVKYNSSGTAQWYQTLPPAETGRGYGIEVDSSGSVYVTGFYNSYLNAISLGNGLELPQTGFDYDVYIVKYDTSGTAQWYKTISGPYSDVGNAIAVDSGGNVYVTGYYTSTTAISLGNGLELPAPTGIIDVFIVKYSGDRTGFSVSLSADGSRVATGGPSNGSSSHVRVYESSSINETTHTDRLLNTSSSDQSFSIVLKGSTIGSSTNTKRSDHRTIKNIDFQCNGATVFDHSGQYLAYQQALRYHTGCPDPAYEFYTYSFALKPEVYYPTGQLNMSRIIHKKLDIELDTVPTATSGSTVADKTRNINVDVYALNYNVLHIESGLAGLKF